MAGHSKWANIRFRKAGQDSKRSKIFTKLIREITVAAKMGEPDPEQNPRLRDAIDKGLKANMKRDTIDKAIQRGAGYSDSLNMNEVRYEGYGPGGVAILVETLTDNKNRTVSEIRHTFFKMGGNLGTDGSVAYLFEKKGVLRYGSDVDETELMSFALEVGAEDLVIQTDPPAFEVVTAAEDYYRIKDCLETHFACEEATFLMQANTQICLNTREEAERFLTLMDKLEALDDVQAVYANAAISDVILAEISTQ